MNNLFEQFKDDYRSHQMTDAEKSSIRTSLISHMGAPLSRPQKSPYSTWVRFSLRTLAFGIIGIMASGVGLTYASQDAMPGDTLYAFKVHVAEEIIERTKVSSPQRAQYAIERMARRLDEAEYLATSSSLTTKHQSDLTRLAAAHAQDAYDIIDDNERIDQKQRDILHTHIDTTLRARTEKLALIVETQPEMDTLLALADNTLRENVLREDNALSTLRASDERLNEIKERVDTLRMQIPDTHSSSEYRTADISSENIQQLLTQAETKINERKYFEAFTLVRDAQIHSDELMLHNVASHDHIITRLDDTTLTVTLRDDITEERRYMLTLSPSEFFETYEYTFTLSPKESSHTLHIPLHGDENALARTLSENITLSLSVYTERGSYELATQEIILKSQE